MNKLNLGCGKDIKRGYINLDVVRLDGVDVVTDIERKMPFPDNFFDEIYSSHVLEHVNDLQNVLLELHRISKPESLIKVLVPYFSFFGSHTNPTHKRFWGYDSFDYFSENSDINFYTKPKFKIVKKEILFYWMNNKKVKIKSHLICFLINLWPLFYERFFCWILPANEIYYEIQPIK
jgi:ubiquinone/menaquinone biosynthesis C-methylase UbiE